MQDPDLLSDSAYTPQSFANTYVKAQRITQAIKDTQELDYNIRWFVEEGRSAEAGSPRHDLYNAYSQLLGMKTDGKLCTTYEGMDYPDVKKEGLYQKLNGMLMRYGIDENGVLTNNYAGTIVPDDQFEGIAKTLEECCKDVEDTMSYVAESAKKVQDSRGLGQIILDFIEQYIIYTANTPSRNTMIKQLKQFTPKTPAVEARSGFANKEKARRNNSSVNQGRG